jgi:hypothetical protein
MTIENLTPPPPSPRSLWKPIGLTLLASFLLAFCTCAGGFSVGKGPDGLGSFLIYSGLFFIAVFLLTLCFAAIYLVIWLTLK